MAGKSVEDQFAEEQARLAISQQYLARDGNPEFDPMRQEQLDRNRIPGQLGEEQLSPGPHVNAGSDAQSPPFAANVSISAALSRSATQWPYRTLALAAGMGIVLGALWKS
jgi:hypothetical protein